MTPRLLLLTVDRLPAWMLSAWGATWVSTPAIDGLAGRGLVCDRLVATSLDPLRTLVDLAGGLLAAAAAAGLEPQLVTDDAGVAAAMAPEAHQVEVVPAVVPRRAARQPGDTNLGRLFAAARAAVGRGHGLVWVHAGSLGVAWDAPASFLEPYLDPDDPPPPTGVAVPSVRVDADTDPDLPVGYRQVYAAQLTLLDRLLGELVAALPAGEGPGQGWGICLVGVRGLPLGLHGSIGVPDPPREELPFGETIHLPALLVDRGGRMAGQRFPGLTIPADLGVTLRGLLGLPMAAANPGADPCAGRSLTGLFVDWSHLERDRVICVAPAGVAVVTPAWHLVLEGELSGNPRMRLYAKPDDFFELSDVADRCPQELSGLARLAAVARGEAPSAAWTIPLDGGGEDLA